MREDTQGTAGPWFIQDMIAAWPDLHAIARELDRRATINLTTTMSDLHAIARELDRLSLVIKSAVRNAGDAHHHKAILALLRANKIAIAKAEGRHA